MSTAPGRFTRTAIHCEAGEAELRMTAAGNWQVAIRAAEAGEWRLACSGDLEAGARSLFERPREKPQRIGQLTVDTAGRRAEVEGKELKLNTKEFNLLAMLATEPERVFNKQELMSEIWGYDTCHSVRTLDCHASKLRVELRRAGAEGYVVNCWGGSATGYGTGSVVHSESITAGLGRRDEPRLR
jgi:DNA-binding response OmpR family regulator